MLKFCSLFSGSSGNALFLSTEKTRILVDAGLSGKKVIQALTSIGEDPRKLSALLVTHEHSDHTRGIGILSRRFNLPVYANEKTWEAMEMELGPIDSANRRIFSTGCEFCIDDLCIRPFPIPHDASEPVGFNYLAGRYKVTTATDIGHVTKELLSNLDGSDLLLLEANHDVEMLKVGPYPYYLKKRILGDYGHLSNELAGDVIAWLAERGGHRFLLGHLSKENNFPQLAYQTVCNALTEKSIQIGGDVMLEVALRDQVGKVIEL